MAATTPDLTPFMGTVVLAYPSKFDENKMVIVFARPGFVPAYEGDRSGQVTCKVDRGKEGRFVPGTQVLITPRQATVKGAEVVYYNPPREYTDGSPPPVDARSLAQRLAGVHVACAQAVGAAYAGAGLPVPPGAAGELFAQVCQALPTGGGAIAPPPQSSPYGVAAGSSITPTPASFGDDEIPF